MYSFNFIHSNLLFKTLPQSFYIARQQKSYGVRHSVRAVSNPRRRLRLPPSQPIVILYYLDGGKHPVAEKIMRWRNNYPTAETLSGAGAGGPKILKKISQCQKLPHSTENTLFQNLIPCEISSAQNRTLSPILLHYRSYTLSFTLPSYLNKLTNLFPILIH